MVLVFHDPGCQSLSSFTQISRISNSHYNTIPSSTTLLVKRKFYELYGDKNAEEISNLNLSSPSSASFSSSPPATPTTPPFPPTTLQKTEKGGTLHTWEARMKISKANRGKIPWNKDLKITETRRDNIRAGVIRARLKKLNMTQKQYEQQLLEKEDKKRRHKFNRENKVPLSPDRKKKLSHTMKEVSALANKRKWLQPPTSTTKLTHSICSRTFFARRSSGPTRVTALGEPRSSKLGSERSEK